jgi:hypothetical protein
VSELLGSDVAIKLEYMPQVIIYSENKNTSNAIGLRAFFMLFIVQYQQVAGYQKKRGYDKKTQLLALNSGKFCALVRLAGKIRYKTRIIIR